MKIFDTLPETNVFAPENGWLEDDPFLLGRPIFRCELLVSGRVIPASSRGVSGSVGIMYIIYVYINTYIPAL